MKKLLFLFSCSLLALSAGAQKIEPVKTMDGYARSFIIPGRYTCDNKGRFYTIGNYRNIYTYKVKLFDENLNEEKSFYLRDNNDVVGYKLINIRDTIYVETKQEEGDKELIYIDTSVTDINNVTIDNFKNFIKYDVYDSHGYMMPSYLTYKEVARTGTTITFELGVDEDKAKSSMGWDSYVTYCKGTFECSIENTSRDKGALFKGILSNYVYKRTQTGDWKEKREETGNSGKRYMNIYTYDVCTGKEEGNAILTQRFFNKDGLYEYIQPIYELYEGGVQKNDTDGDGEIDEIVTSYYTRDIGFQIVQDNGTILSSVKYGDGMHFNWSDYDALYTIVFAEKTYIMANVIKEGGADAGAYSIFYTFDPSDPTSIKAVRTEKTGIKAMPAIARQSEVVNVDVSKFKNPRHVSVVSSSGQTVMTRHIADGQSNVEVQTSGLPAGLYIVKVTDGQSVSDNCKIIIR